MTSVITVPPSLDDHTFEQVVEQLASVPHDAKLLVDARHTRWASPYGLTALLTLGQTREERASFAVPEAEETASYWARTGFFTHAEEIYDLHGSVPKARGGESSVLLEITQVAKSEDVHEVVGRIQQKAQLILSKELNIDAKATVGFAMTLSEICQNIIEHAGRGGFVAVQTYTYRKRLANRRVVVIAVCDAGCGFRQSLESAPGFVRNDRWDDAAALEAAVIRGVSRFRDPGRGQGLAGVRRYIGRWDGKVSVRSGTAKIAIVPSWDDDVPLAEKLAPFPGSQVQVTIPERVSGGPRQ
ncbi:MAG TPA: ATP-binding protein [Gemmatimonadaceae bacterium]